MGYQTAKLKRDLGFPKLRGNERGVKTYEDQWTLSADGFLKFSEIEHVDKMPSEGSQFDDDENAYLATLTIDPKQDGKTATGRWLWTVSATYRTDIDYGQTAKNPINRDCKLRWASQRVLKYEFADLNGKPLANNVGDPFENPPPREKLIHIFRVSQNREFYNSAWVTAWANTINSEDWLRDGNGQVVFPKHTVRLASINSGDFTCENGYWYWPVEYEFWCCDPADPWYPLKVINAGPRVYTSHDDTQPKLLKDTDGGKNGRIALIAQDGTEFDGVAMRTYLEKKLAPWVSNPDPDKDNSDRPILHRGALEKDEDKKVTYVTFSMFRKKPFGELGILLPPQVNPFSERRVLEN